MKRRVRLTEGNLRRMVYEAVQRVLWEAAQPAQQAQPTQQAQQPEQVKQPSGYQPFTTYQNPNEPWQDTNNEMADVYRQMEVARANGDATTVRKLQQQMGALYQRQKEELNPTPQLGGWRQIGQQQGGW